MASLLPLIYLSIGLPRSNFDCWEHLSRHESLYEDQKTAEVDVSACSRLRLAF